MASAAAYYRLAKPGIIYGNGLTAIGGFLFASRQGFAVAGFLGMIIGVSLVIAAACVFNNCLDRNIDKKMVRTKKRALITDQISLCAALMFGSVLLALGVSLLSVLTNVLTLFVTLTGFFVYVVVYALGKRRSVHGTVIGSIAGAVPVVAGYTAASGRLDIGAAILFLILATWQMPHFYAIAIYRLKDYAAASLPVLPVKKGLRATKRSIVIYLAAFVISLALLTFYGGAGLVYLVVMLVLSLLWFKKGLAGFTAEDETAWARGVFRFSLVVITAFSVMVSLDPLLP